MWQRGAAPPDWVTGLSVSGVPDVVVTGVVGGPVPSAVPGAVVAPPPADGVRVGVVSEAPVPSAQAASTHSSAAAVTGRAARRLRGVVPIGPGSRR
ncbi:hypothetical protein GCM10010378_63580 [Streptomyces viridochromogenes]